MTRNSRQVGFLAITLLGLLFPAFLVRASVTNCDGISPVSAQSLTTVQVASGLLRPLFVTSPPGDAERLFIVEQDGRIQLLRKGVLSTFLDLTAITRSPADGGGNEEGLLGLAFPPDYASTGVFFVYHTLASLDNVVARYRRLDQDTGDATTRQVVLTFLHPTNTNHNGGMIAFGPDGYLWIATGDGGGSCDSPGNAQNGTSMLGKLLRIHVKNIPYEIPADNPFVGPGGFNDEIWSYGLRNPWRFSFDRDTSDLYIGDVGQNLWEEVDYRPAGSPGGDNYGWDLYEGAHCPNPSCGSQGPTCSPASYVPPILEYSISGTPCAITGGYVYRGCRMPELHGTYFYSDFCAAFLRTFQVVGGVATNQVDRTAQLAPGGGLVIESVNSFGEDARGEIYIVDRGGLSPSTATGEVYKVVPAFSSFEVSAQGAAPFLMGASVWSWEDLATSSSYPIAVYRVYRSPGRGDGSFTCIHRDGGFAWEGDPTVLDVGQIYSYIVTATNAAGLQTSPGTSTSGVLRKLAATACP